VNGGMEVIENVWGEGENEKKSGGGGGGGRSTRIGSMCAVQYIACM